MRTLSNEETEARDMAFKAGDGCSVREGEIWDAAWLAARDYYVPSASDLCSVCGDDISRSDPAQHMWDEHGR